MTGRETKDRTISFLLTSPIRSRRAGYDPRGLVPRDSILRALDADTDAEDLLAWETRNPAPDGHLVAFFGAFGRRSRPAQHPLRSTMSLMLSWAVSRRASI